MWHLLSAFLPLGLQIPTGFFQNLLWKFHIVEIANIMRGSPSFAHSRTLFTSSFHIGKDTCAFLSKTTGRGQFIHWTLQARNHRGLLGAENILEFPLLSSGGQLQAVPNRAEGVKERRPPPKLTMANVRWGADWYPSLLAFTF